MDRHSALLIVDLQNDFCASGALPVPDGERVVEPLNRAAKLFGAEGLAVLFSRDWHPRTTCHFREFGGIWPSHCIQGSRGAEFHPGLQPPPGAVIISKGCAPDSNGYSAFDGKSDNGRTLGEILEELDVDHLYIGGLASDYCVLSSVLDARQAGYEVTVLSDGIAGVNITAGDSEKALREMERSGAHFCTVDELFPGREV